jgi:hypothetical protein
MRVELIDKKEPRDLRIGGDGAGKMRRTVCFRSAGPDGRRHHFPSHHVEVGDPALRPMTEVFLRRALDQTWLHRQGGGGTLPRLYPGLLIRTDDRASGLGHGWRLLRRGTHSSHWGGQGQGGLRLGGEPVLHPRGLQIRLIVTNARHYGG